VRRYSRLGGIIEATSLKPWLEEHRSCRGDVAVETASSLLPPPYDGGYAEK
jgi:hypothetical protein